MSDSRALVLGAGGQLGQACVAAAPSQLRVNGLTRVQCDVTDEGVLRDCLQRLSPQIIINAAAYTAVDDAEDNVNELIRIFLFLVFFFISDKISKKAVLP